MSHRKTTWTRTPTPPIYIAPAAAYMHRTNKSAQLTLDALTYQCNRGGALYKQHKWPEALEAFTKASEMVPNDAAYRDRLGKALMKLGRDAPAVTALQKAVALAPSNKRYTAHLTRAQRGPGFWECLRTVRLPRRKLTRPERPRVAL